MSAGVTKAEVPDIPVPRRMNLLRAGWRNATNPGQKRYIDGP